MIDLSSVVALARAEARLTRRLVRYWVFQSLALVIGLGIYGYYIFLHMAFSSYSATVAIINPRYLVGFMGIYYLVVFLIGLIFLGFDVRARDVRERMGEVLDSRPYSNVELLLGKFLGIMAPSWIPVVVITLIWVLIGLLFDSSIEPISLITFAVAMAIPAYTFVLGMTFLLTLLLKHRLLAGVAATIVVVGLIVINFGLVPIWALPIVDITGGFSGNPPSDIIPTVMPIQGVMQRAGFLLMGLGMLWLAAAVHPRRDDSARSVTAGIGGGMFVAGVALCVIFMMQTLGVIDQRTNWRAAHEARRLDPAPDLISISGEVRMIPDRLLLDLNLVLEAPADAALEAALFTLNPGLEVAEVRGENGEALSFEQHDGLLDITLPASLAPGSRTSLSLSADGTPDPNFAYLEAAFDPLELNIREGNIFILGFQSIIYERRYAALLPGARWLPTPGAESGRGDPAVRPLDFFDLDLTVEVPDGWLLAGPARRESVPGEGTRFRYRPTAPLPEVALVGGRFVSRKTEIQGIELEALLVAGHEESLDFFADAVDPLEAWLEERLGEAREVGLAYPFDALTMVEIPGLLRGYAGGWRMDSTLAQPGMVLVREAGFPTARFDTRYGDAGEFEDEEGGLPAAKVRALQRFFETDFSGGNPFVAAARSFFTYQTSARGADGLPMDFVWEDLSTRLVTEKQGYFSIHHYGSDMNTTINSSISAVLGGDGSGSMADAIITSITSRPDVWDAVLGASLADLDPWQAPKRALDVLTLKGGAMARSLLDGLGREQSGHFLGALREQNLGSAYDREGVLRAGEAIGEDFDPWLEVWINETSLPGFIVRDLQLDRIEDSEDGAPRYQTIVLLQNAELAPGLLRVGYSGEDDEQAARGSTDPIRIDAASAVEIGFVTSKPPSRIEVEPYLSMNRGSFQTQLPAVDETTVLDSEPFSGVRPIEWVAPDDGSVLIDDLDPGFSVARSGQESRLRVGGSTSEDDETDGGLPVSKFGRAPSRWSRRESSSAYGRYRHTLALIRAGKGERWAVFGAELPRSGQWEVELHMPTLRERQRERSGSYTMRLVDSSGENAITFDAKSSEGGWNSLGRFELASGEVRLELSDETDGNFVLGDAVRWRPVERHAQEVASR